MLTPGVTRKPTMKTKLTVKNRGVTLLKAKLILDIVPPGESPAPNVIEQKLYHYKPDKCYVLSTDTYKEREENGYTERISNILIGQTHKRSYHQFPCERYSDSKLLEMAEQLETGVEDTHFKGVAGTSLYNGLWNALKVYPSQVAPIEHLVPSPTTGMVINRLKKAVLIKEGTSKEFWPENNGYGFRPFTLQELYRHLECDTIRVVNLENGNMLIIDEEGKIKGLPVNKEATALMPYIFRTKDRIVGPAILCPSDFLT